MTEQDFTHFDESGRARMVNVGDKEITKRTAAAEGRVLVNPRTFALIKSGGMKKKPEEERMCLFNLIRFIMLSLGNE